MRLIDADALEKIFESWLKECSFCAPDDNTEGAAIHACLCQLQDATTIEAKHVKHGHWAVGEKSISKFLCSECGCADKELRPFYVNIWNYCPNCGAKMKGESNE